MRLEKLRERRGVSVREVARQVGEPYSSVDRWFRGSHVPRLDQAVKLARYFGVSLDELAGTGGGAADLTDRERELVRLARLVGLDEAERRLLLAGVGAEKRPAAPQVGEPVDPVTGVALHGATRGRRSG